MTRFDQLALATALLTLVWCGPATATAADAPRARISADKAAVDARYRAAQAACRERFVVTSCVDAATAQRRKELAALREQELAIDDAERKQRAALRRSEVAEKQSRLAARAASAPPPAAKASARPATPASAPPRAAPHASAALDGGPTQAAERAAHSTKRQGEAQATRERIKAREVRKAEEAKASAAAQKKAAPLPTPSSTRPSVPASAPERR